MIGYNFTKDPVNLSQNRGTAFLKEFSSIKKMAMQVFLEVPFNNTKFVDPGIHLRPMIMSNSSILDPAVLQKIREALENFAQQNKLNNVSSVRLPYLTVDEEILKPFGNSLKRAYMAAYPENKSKSLYGDIKNLF